AEDEKPCHAATTGTSRRAARRTARRGRAGAAGGGKAGRPAPRRSPSPCRPLAGGCPRGCPFEGLFEVEDVGEVLGRILGLLDEDSAIDEGEDHVAEVPRRLYAPVLQHRSGHGAEALDREIADPFGQLAPADVARLRQLL